LSSSQTELAREFAPKPIRRVFAQLTQSVRHVIIGEPFDASWMT
jgi:hypothetical protein